MAPSVRCALTLLGLALASTSHAALVADYQFQGNLNSSVGSAPALADVGMGNGFADSVHMLHMRTAACPTADKA